MSPNHHVFASLLSEPSVRSLIGRIRKEGRIEREVFSALGNGILSDPVRWQGLVAMVSFFCPLSFSVPPQTRVTGRTSRASARQEEPLPEPCEDWEEDFKPDDNLARYFADIRRIPRLSEVEERELYCQLAACTDPEELDRLRQKLVSANLRFVVKIAKAYQDRGLKLMDLVEAGNEGIVLAAERFNPAQGFKFITYAVWWIRQRICRVLKDNYNRVARFPENQIQDIFKFREIGAKLEQFLGRSPTDEEFSEYLGVPLERVRELQEFTPFHRIAFLDASVKDSEKTEIGDLLEDSNSPEPTHQAEQAYIREMIQQVMDHLPAREAAVLRFRYGLVTGGYETLENTAETLGSGLRKNIRFQYGRRPLTRERVRQIEERALQHCRNIWQEIHGKSILESPAYTYVQDLFHESQKEAVE